MDTDRRLMPRYHVALPIVVGGMSGTTKDVGVTGVSFIAPRRIAPNQVIEFSITVAPEPRGLVIDCKGTVKRAAAKGGHYEIVATIETLDLRPAR